VKFVSANSSETSINLIFGTAQCPQKDSGQLDQYSEGLRTGQPGFDSRQEQVFSPLHSVQAGSGAYPAPNPMDNGRSFPEGKAAGA
jgi:hypothetical protein